MLGNEYTGKGKFVEDIWFKNTPKGFVLVGSRCETCKKTFFPKKIVCPNCFDSDLKEVPLSRKGRLHTYSVSAMGPPEMKKPYAIGFIDLPEGIRVFSILNGCEPWDEVLKVNMEMEMIISEIKKDESNDPIWSYKFRPVGTEAKK